MWLIHLDSTSYKAFHCIDRPNKTSLWPEGGWWGEYIVLILWVRTLDLRQEAVVRCVKCTVVHEGFDYLLPETPWAASTFPLTSYILSWWSNGQFKLFLVLNDILQTPLCSILAPKCQWKEIQDIVNRTATPFLLPQINGDKCPFPPHMLPDPVEFLQHCVLPTISMIISPCNQPLTYLIAPWIPHPFNCCFPVNAHYSLLHYYFIHKLFSLSPLNLPSLNSVPQLMYYKLIMHSRCSWFPTSQFFALVWLFSKALNPFQGDNQKERFEAVDK